MLRFAPLSRSYEAMDLKDLATRNRSLRNLAYRSAASLLVRPCIASLRVPVVAVTGTNGKTMVVKLVGRFLRAGVVTNVFEDHLRDRGVETVEEMALVKSAVAKRTRAGVECRPCRLELFFGIDVIEHHVLDHLHVPVHVEDADDAAALSGRQL